MKVLGGAEDKKQADIMNVVNLLESLSPIQIEVIKAIIQRFASGCEGSLERDDFLTKEAYEFFSMRLAAHHAYSSHMLKKENFEHILEQSFRRAGVPTERQNSMTVRGADLRVGDVRLSLKTEAARDLRQHAIVISKLMEAAWIKQITSTDDIPGMIRTMVLPHFENYDRIMILRCYPESLSGLIRYDLREIPMDILQGIGALQAGDFSPLTKTRTTSATVRYQGRPAFKFRLDGSDDKLTVTSLAVSLCPLHAWWSLAAPDA